MATFELNGAQYDIPADQREFAALIERLATQHTGVREQVLLFSFRAGHTSEARYQASMVGQVTNCIFHLLFEMLGRPQWGSDGFYERELSTAQVAALLCVAAPLGAGGHTDPHIQFLRDAHEDGIQVTASILGQATDALKTTPRYADFRTNLLFSLFNEGALRGSDGNARQALLDSFSYLPNMYLNSEGHFLSNETLRRAAATGPKTIASQVGGIDKFPSLMAVRAERLMRDGNRIVPGVMIRDGVHIGKRNIFMFHAAVNIAAYIGDDNIVDSHASIASAAQVGNRNKIGSFVSMEGVLSPANAKPVYVGDQNFIGSFARLGTGIVVGNDNFIGAGVNLSKGTKLKDCREQSSTRGQYVYAQDLNGFFNHLALAPNNAARDFNGVSLLPGEYILFDNTEEFMDRFEGDIRIKA